MTKQPEQTVVTTAEDHHPQLVKTVPPPYKVGDLVIINHEWQNIFDKGTIVEETSNEFVHTYTVHGDLYDQDIEVQANAICPYNEEKLAHLKDLFQQISYHQQQYEALSEELHRTFTA